MIKSFAPQGGTIDKIYVQEGTQVAKGDPLITLIIHRNNADGLSLSSKLLTRLESQLRLLDEEIAQYQTIERKEHQNLN